MSGVLYYGVTIRDIVSPGRGPLRAPPQKTKRTRLMTQTDPMVCFGHLEKVFPMGEDGFRTSPSDCMKCPMVKPCIQAAMKGAEGLKLEEKRIDRAYECGLIGTLERWSKKKLIRRKIEEQNNQREKKQKPTP